MAPTDIALTDPSKLAGSAKVGSWASGGARSARPASTISSADAEKKKPKAGIAAWDSA